MSRVLRASAIMAAGTMVSRVTGFVRTAVLAAAIGTFALGDAYNVAYTIPLILFDLLIGGILSSVVVPMIVKRQKSDPDGGRAYEQRLMTLGVVVLTLMALVAVALASSHGKASSGGKAVSGRRAAPSRGRAVVSRERALALRGRVAAATALRQAGRPYVWGGGSSTGPTGGGFDCSGLTLHAWAKAGARLTHYTGAQFREGRRVPFSQLRPGDLVFFGGGGGDPTHVGVYVKDGVMVHAPKTGDVVGTVDFAASPYYISRYRGAVRPTPR